MMEKGDAAMVGGAVWAGVGWRSGAEGEEARKKEEF